MIWSTCLSQGRVGSASGWGLKQRGAGPCNPEPKTSKPCTNAASLNCPTFLHRPPPPPTPHSPKPKHEIPTIPKFEGDVQLGSGPDSSIHAACACRGVPGRRLRGLGLMGGYSVLGLRVKRLTGLRCRVAGFGA